MKIIVKKVKQGRGKAGGRMLRTASVFTATALALLMMRGAADSSSAKPVNASGVRFLVSGSDSAFESPVRREVIPDPAPGSGSAADDRDSLTVDDELSDLLLDEEIDSGVSASYNGKLDVPANVRLDRLDFGEDFVRPLKKARVTSRFDYRVNPVTGRYVFHTGMDLGAAQGSDIMAMKAGRVVSAGYNGGYGNMVIVEHAGGIRTLYAHCSKLLVKTGDKVRKGQVIARVGSTGNSTGPHLHIEFRKNGKRYDPEWVIGGLYN